MVPYTWGSLGQVGNQQGRRALGAGQRGEQGPPGLQKAELGGTSRKAFKVPLCTGALHLLSREPLPFYTHAGDNATQEDFWRIQIAFHIQIQLVEEKLLLIALAGVGTTSLSPVRACRNLAQNLAR